MFNETNTLTTTEPTENFITTDIPNSTLIDTLIETVTSTIQTVTGPTLEFHSFYIYIWATTILGCIILTTGR